MEFLAKSIRKGNKGIQKKLELVNEFNKSVGYKLITHKSVVFLYTSNLELYKNIIFRVISIYRTVTRKLQAEEGNQR